MGALAVVLAGGVAGCRQDMQDQPKFFPQRGTSFYADGRSARPQVEGTVARGQGDEDSYFFTGMIAGKEGGLKEGDAMPFPVTREVLERGQERYNIYCTPCHSRVGNGLGMIVLRGYYPAADFNTDRLREAPLGHFFNVMTHGYGAMPEYAAQLSAQDRWAVAAYIRALQLSQNAKQTDAAAGARAEPLEDVEEREGFGSGFVDAWRPANSVGQPAKAAEMMNQTPIPAGMADAGAGAGAGGGGALGAGAAAVAPVKAEADAAPVAPVRPKGDPVAGQAVYVKNCQLCHQPTRTGIPPMIPSLVGVVKKLGPDKIRSNVKNGVPTGKPPMPSFAAVLSDKDIEDVIAFLGSAK
jgi:mono/diheme cytochrome c family protein